MEEAVCYHVQEGFAVIRQGLFCVYRHDEQASSVDV